MYSGTIISRGSGRIIGTHQKIDRVARRKLQTYLPDGSWFPKTYAILRFEGLNGPDGIKRKSPARDEPRHFINPDDPSDTHLLELISGNENNLIKALRENNREKASFEAAWLAHAITDGLTPAHHYPYEERLAELRGTGDDAIQDTVRKKFVMPGNTMIEKISNNWEYWKPNGLMTAHGLYELGVAIIAAPLRFNSVGLTAEDKAMICAAGGIVSLYRGIVNEVYSKHMYTRFLDEGWTQPLAQQTKDFLMPKIIHTVLLSWYYCAWKSVQDNTN